MNVGKSIKVALAMREMNQRQLAAKLGQSERWINQLANSQTASSQTIEKLANAFEMKSSEFVALGEG